MIVVRNQRIVEFQLHWSTFEKLFEDCWHIFYSYVNSLSIETPLNINCIDVFCSWKKKKIKKKYKSWLYGS
jgi:hypothetical protein